jgi:hypothetical protein
MLLGQRGEPQIRLHSLHIGKLGLRLLVGDFCRNNYIITGLPVGGRIDAVLVRGEQGIHDAEQFSRAAASGGGIGLNEADDLVGVNDEDGADGVGDASGVDVGCVLVVEPFSQTCQRLRSTGAV